MYLQTGQTGPPFPPTPPSSHPFPPLTSMRGTEKATACKWQLPPDSVCLWAEVGNCAAASLWISAIGIAMFASIWYAKKLGRRFVHNARKAKSEKVWSKWGWRLPFLFASCPLWTASLSTDAVLITLGWELASHWECSPCHFQKGRLLEPSYLGGEHTGLSGIISYSKWYLVVSSIETVSPQRLNFPLNDIGWKHVSSCNFASLGSSLVNLLLYCIIFITTVFDSEEGMINPWASLRYLHLSLCPRSTYWGLSVTLTRFHRGAWYFFKSAKPSFTKCIQWTRIVFVIR